MGAGRARKNHQFLRSNIRVKSQYSWIAHQLDIGTMLAFLLSGSDFKSETSFGFPGPNYTRQNTWFFVKSQNVLVWLVTANMCFPEGFRHCICPFSSNSESDARYERISSTWLRIFKKNENIVSYWTITGTREHDIIQRMQISSTSLTN